MRKRKWTSRLGLDGLLSRVSNNEKLSRDDEKELAGLAESFKTSNFWPFFFALCESERVFIEADCATMEQTQNPQFVLGRLHQIAVMQRMFDGLISIDKNRRKEEADNALEGEDEGAIAE